MAILKIKRGSGVPSGLTFGELAFDTTNRILRFGVTAGFLNLTSADGGVATFNGLTGAVSGVTTSVANVFTPIQTFNSGITSAGATFTAATHCLRGLTVGLIGSGGNLNVIGRTTLQNLIVDGSGGATFNCNIIQVGSTRGISTQGFARIGTNLSVGLGATFSGWIAGNTLSSFANGSTLTISSPASFLSEGNIRITPQGTFVVAPESSGIIGGIGSIPALTISNFQTAGTGVVVSGSDFVIGAKNDGEWDIASSLVFKGVITNSNTYIYPQNVSSGLEYSIGVPARNGTFALLEGPQTFSGTNSFSNGLSAAGGTFSGNINLQNAEFIRNTTNGRMDFMPSPSGSGNYGLYADFTSWGFGARLGTIRSSDQALNVGAVLFDTDCVLLGSKFFAMEPGQTIKFLASGPDSNNNTTLQCTVQTGAGKTGNAFVLMDNSSTGYGTTRVPTVSFANPNFFIYSGVSVRNNANDFIRFEHDVNNGRIVSGGTSGINLEPGSGIVGVSGGISAGSFILNSSGIKTLTGTTYTFLASDNGTVLTHNNSSGCTFTVPTGLPVGYSTTVLQLNSAGTVRFIAASGVTLNSFANYTTLAGQHASASLISYTTNIYNLAGNLS